MKFPRLIFNRNFFLSRTLHTNSTENAHITCISIWKSEGIRMQNYSHNCVKFDFLHFSISFHSLSLFTQERKEPNKYPSKLNEYLHTRKWLCRSNVPTREWKPVQKRYLQTNSADRKGSCAHLIPRLFLFLSQISLCMSVTVPKWNTTVLSTISLL